MQTDKYTKVVLTAIAIGLFLNAATSFIPVAYAYVSPAEVKVINYETSENSGETLYVYCKNCE